MKTILILLTGIISNTVGFLAQITKPNLIVQKVIKIYAKFYRVNLEEASKPLSEYRSMQEFFSRDLVTGIRPLHDNLIVPVDATLRDIGQVSPSQTIEHIKGRSYTLNDLLQDDLLAKKFIQGSYANFYLSPKDYHHIHSPCSGKIIQTTHIPGALLPVNNFTFNKVPKLFAINERVITYIESEYGLIAVVMVGALNVGKILVQYDKDFVCKKTNHAEKRNYNFDVTVGDKIGSFLLGSSVVVLFEKSREFSGVIPREVRLGEKL